MKELEDVDIKAFLERASLYSWHEFRWPEEDISSLYIREIDAYCEICNQDRPFHNVQHQGIGLGKSRETLKTGVSTHLFSCVSCRRAHRQYHVEHVVEVDTIRLQKYGERPRQLLRRNRTMQKFFAEDADSYEKAIICLSHEYGIAAFAYFRRILENNIDRLLDSIKEDALASGHDTEALEALAQLRSDSPMSEKIRIANRALPSHLKPDGLNPLGKLYQVLSQGIHNLPDSDCLKLATATDECLSFLLTELASRRKHREKFRQSVAGLGDIPTR